MKTKSPIVEPSNSRIPQGVVGRPSNSNVSGAHPIVARRIIVSPSLSFDPLRDVCGVIVWKRITASNNGGLGERWTVLACSASQCHPDIWYRMNRLFLSSMGGFVFWKHGMFAFVGCDA
ncbi:hypothetical protein CDAR_298121 [Caerostris darwini]|uniref:Uncharacterized protein n=1 Tax=Caerostris darwini TaxID=1538125 RepID=A0AAV4PWN3_9ARAC|nr:hypothetical protein CDAR_298121 [Caerostris darwini]